MDASFLCAPSLLNGQQEAPLWRRPGGPSGGFRVRLGLPVVLVLIGLGSLLEMDPAPPTLPVFPTPPAPSALDSKLLCYFLLVSQINGCGSVR